MTAPTSVNEEGGKSVGLKRMHTHTHTHTHTPVSYTHLDVYKRQQVGLLKQKHIHSISMLPKSSNFLIQSDISNVKLWGQYNGDTRLA